MLPLWGRNTNSSSNALRATGVLLLLPQKMFFFFQLSNQEGHFPMNIKETFLRRFQWGGRRKELRGLDGSIAERPGIHKSLFGNTERWERRKRCGGNAGGTSVSRSWNPFHCCGDGLSDGGRSRGTTRREFQSEWRPPLSFPCEGQTRQPLFSVRARLRPHVVGGRRRAKAGEKVLSGQNPDDCPNTVFISCIALSLYSPPFLFFFFFSLARPSSSSSPPVSPSHLSARSAAKGKPSQVQSN